MFFKTLDTVVITTDLPSAGLKCGDLGTVVEVYSELAVEVEFVTASGNTQAIVTLGANHIRPVGARDLLAVRQLDAA